VDKRIYKKWLATMKNIEEKIMRAQREIRVVLKRKKVYK